MRKEYIKPEAEMMKFLEEEEIMEGPNTGLDMTSFDFSQMAQTAGL